MAVIWCKPPVRRATWWENWAARVAHKRNLNRQLAFEAMMDAMLARVQPEALPGLREEYEQACDRLAAGLRPAMQEPALWTQWSDAITERMQSLAPIPPVAPEKPYED